MAGILLLLIVIVTTPLGLVIHELGHFVAARVLSLEIVSFQAGPFVVDWKSGESTFRFRPLLWLSGGRRASQDTCRDPEEETCAVCRCWTCG